MEEYEIHYDIYCPKCGHSPLHSRTCVELMCNEGVMDESDDDPINFIPGESEYPCPECRGTGIEWWCPSCGENLSGMKLHDEQDEDLPNYPSE